MTSNDPKFINSEQKNIQKVFSPSSEKSEAKHQIMEYSPVET